MIIGFTGEMGSGKSTVIRMLAKFTLPHIPHLVKFADPLYSIQEFIYSTISPVYRRPESFIKDRKLLQWIGTEWGRESISETLWVDLWKAKAAKLIANGSTIVVSDDVRFSNEAEAVKAAGGFVVKILSSENSKRIDTTSGLVHHKSEAGIDHKFIDYFIDNNGTLEHLETQVASLVAELIERNEYNGI